MSIIFQLLHNTTCARIAKTKSQTDGQLAEWKATVMKKTHDHTTVEVFLMLYIVYNVNSNGWFVLGMTTLQAAHRNGSTTHPVTKLPKVKLMCNLNGSHAITT